jgi:magnesium transporter
MNPNTRLGMAFLNDHPVEAASVLENYPAEKVVPLLARARTDAATGMLENFSPGFATSCIAALDSAIAIQLFAALATERQVTLLRQMESGVRDTFLQQLRPELAASLWKRLPYPENTAGSLMEMSVASVPASFTIRETLNRIRRTRRGMKSYIYVTDPQGRLAGVVSLHELLTQKSYLGIAEIMHRNVVSIAAREPLHRVIRNTYWHEYHALPVTDENGTLLGVLRQRELLQLLDEFGQNSMVDDGLNILVAISELYSITAEGLITALMKAGTTGGQPASSKPVGTGIRG